MTKPFSLASPNSHSMVNGSEMDLNLEATLVSGY